MKKDNESIANEKTLDVTSVEDAKDKINDIKVFGNGDLFQLISKASSEQEGWMKSTKAMEVKNAGCVLQISTQQRNADGSYSIAEACCFVSNVVIKTDENGNKYLYRII